MGLVWRDGKWEHALSTERHPINYHADGWNPLTWHYWLLERSLVDAWRKQVCDEINEAIQRRKVWRASL